MPTQSLRGKQGTIRRRNRFGDRRRTTLKTVDSAEYNAEDFIEHEEVHLVLSRNGWLRKIKTLANPSTLKLKENDELLGIVKANTRDNIAFFTSFGMVYVHKIYNLPYSRGGFGDPIQNLFKFGNGEKVIHLLALENGKEPGDEEGESSKNGSKQKSFAFTKGKKEEKTEDLECLIASSSGFGFRVSLSNLTETTRSGRKLMSLKNDDRMVGLALANRSHIFFASVQGKGLLVPIDRIPQLSGSGKGVTLMKLAGGELAGFKVVETRDKATLVFADGSQKEIRMKSVPVYNRGSQGVIISKRKKIATVL